jgi:VanZ family protein
MMRVLRHPHTWLTIGWLLLFAAAYVSLMPTQKLPDMNVSDKLEHTIGYVALTLWFAGVYPRSRYLHIAIGMFMFGLIIEYLQGAMQLGRSRDYHDVIANSIGIAIGLAAGWLGLERWAEWIESKVKRW